ncbi:HTH_XRE domain containing protein [uncultured Caudovirales phage]|uniref:HTH_XRE domain containing protein n=1 Tax=uncultured Caudovirales phage TaxID=2100421 RepID=A0A6J5QES0_9CAUD|nr:HTH_XRE domain containing protein [uncultured Caudovirales phage]CAB4173215.1 HTH_XRE domain containing protein [uncultured Caudovirales phage]CAB4179615.1 HTH_XRE domain containing protein [uncultured Caudovirales phage]CAB4203776.1 HTH_XRE domain containing protein [uncultured Caudovirales phage]CAB4216034.1 HTH_XRE domain containing protein [uncultured Caudovirales phage]
MSKLPDPIFATQLGETLAFFRGQMGVSQAAIAARSGITQPALCNYEKGRRVPSVDRFGALAVALEVDAADLLALVTQRVSAARLEAVA